VNTQVKQVDCNTKCKSWSLLSGPLKTACQALLDSNSAQLSSVMHTMDSAQKQDAVNTLRSLGVDLDESKATRKFLRVIHYLRWFQDYLGRTLGET